MKDIVHIFLFSLLLYISVVTGNGPAPVIGRVHGSVLLSYSLSLPVIEAIWDFSFNGRRVKAAEFRNQKFCVTSKKFHSRMEWSDNGATLMIRDLTMEDTGIYTAIIYDTEHTRHEISYNLIVFELVPRPEIKREEKKNEKGQCDYTLHCSVPSDSPELSYSWKYRYYNSEYHHFAHGNSILISSPSDTREFLCLVQNPAHENNCTLVLPACPGIQTEKFKRKHEGQGTIMLLVPLMTGIGVAALVLVAVVFLHVRKRREDKENKKKGDIINADNQKKDIIYSDIKDFPLIRTGQVLSYNNETDSESLLYTPYAVIKR